MLIDKTPTLSRHPLPPNWGSSASAYRSFDMLLVNFLNLKIKQNTRFQERKLKNFLGRGIPLIPNPTPYVPPISYRLRGASILAPSALDTPENQALP
jgi:hypothetical protein